MPSRPARVRQLVRRRVVRSRAMEATRAGVFTALRPLYRQAFDRAATPEAVRRAVRITVPGSSHQIPSEITRFMELAAKRAPAAICEIGTADGGTTVLLSRLAPSVRVIIGIDLVVAHRRFIEGLAPAGQDVHLLDRSSLEPATVTLVEQLAGRPLDVLFVDGSHVYEDVRRDFLTFRRLVRPGGLIAFHDIVPDHAQRHGVDTPMGAGGVPRFWEELRGCCRHWEIVNDPEQDAFGIGVVEHDPATVLPEGWRVET